MFAMIDLTARHHPLHQQSPYSLVDVEALSRLDGKFHAGAAPSEQLLTIIA